MKLRDKNKTEYSFTIEEVELHMRTILDEDEHSIDPYIEWETPSELFILEYDDFLVAYEDYKQIFEEQGRFVGWTDDNQLDPRQHNVFLSAIRGESAILEFPTS
jgi:hypothetical protein